MRNRRFIFFWFLIILSFTNCEEQKATTEKDVLGTDPSDTIQLPTLTGLKPSLSLVKDAQEASEKWVLYKNLSSSLDSLQEGTIGDVRKNVASLEKAFLDLQEAEEAAVDPMPSELKTNAIKARLTALETQIMALKNEVSKNEPIPKAIALGITKSKNALQDLNLQLNERFALSIEEMLEAANEIPDSLLVKIPFESSLPNSN